MLGVYSPTILHMYASALSRLGVEHALVVHCCGLDELAPIGVADAMEVRRGAAPVPITIDPSTMGIPSCTIEDLRGGDATENAAIIRGVLAGGDAADCPVGHTVALNAGAGLYVAGIADDIKHGYSLAFDALSKGKGGRLFGCCTECWF